MMITVTGVDESTNIGRLVDEVQPYAEIGILFSLTQDGRNRYPRITWIDRVAKLLPVCALHVCGGNARHFIRTQSPPFVQHFKRIQINGVVTDAELMHFMQLFPAHIIITQHRFTNQSLVHLSVPTNRHHLLVDNSGGRGVVPSAWASPSTAKRVGFAGGLGPATIEQELPRINKVARDGCWIDMENAIRDELDLFDIGKAVAVIQAVRRNDGL